MSDKKLILNNKKQSSSRGIPTKVCCVSFVQKLVRNELGLMAIYHWTFLSAFYREIHILFSGHILSNAWGFLVPNIGI